MRACMRHIKSILAFCLLPVLAHAEIPPEFCQIKAKVLRDNSTRHVEAMSPQGQYHNYSDLNISLRIQKVKAWGENRNVCDQLKVGSQLDVYIKDVNDVSLKQGQRINLAYFQKMIDGKLVESYQLQGE